MGGHSHLLLFTPLLFSPLATILQLACERQDVVLPNLKALRVHEPEHHEGVETRFSDVVGTRRGDSLTYLLWLHLPLLHSSRTVVDKSKMCSALAPRRHWKSFGAEQVHLSVCCSSSYSSLSVIPSRWSPSTCPVEFLLICGIFSSCDSQLQRPVFQFRYAVPTCDVPPHNAAALTVAQLPPNDPPDLPSFSDTVVTSPPSCNLPQNVLQPAATRAGLPPIPVQLAAAASAVFSLQTQKSRAASQQQQRQLGEPAAGASGGRPVATAAAEQGRWCKRLSR